MVFGPKSLATIPKNNDKRINCRSDIGANDSKQLKEIDRERMLKSIEKCNWIGYTGKRTTPARHHNDT